MTELFSLLLKHVGTAGIIVDIGCADASELDDFEAVFPVLLKNTGI